LLLTKSDFCQNISLISISIRKVIEEFYTKYSRNVDIIDFGGDQTDLVNKIMENLNDSMTVTIKMSKEPQNWNKKLVNQSILLFSNFQDLIKFNLKDLMDMQFINPIRFTIYCQNATTFEISSIKTDLVIPPYYYFIIYDPDDKRLKLLTFENLESLQHCHEIQKLIEINIFSAKLQKWTLNPVFPKKYQNFHGCEMILGVFANGMNLLRFDRKNIMSDLNHPDGPLASVLNDVAQRLNFSLAYIPCALEMCRGLTKRQYIYNVLHVATLDGYSLLNMTAIKWNSAMLNIQCTLV
jgi:hypothetical protein